MAQHSYDHDCYCTDCCDHESRISARAAREVSERILAEERRLVSQERLALRAALQLELVTFSSR